VKVSGGSSKDQEEKNLAKEDRNCGHRKKEDAVTQGTRGTQGTGVLNKGHTRNSLRGRGGRASKWGENQHEEEKNLPGKLGKHTLHSDFRK